MADKNGITDANSANTDDTMTAQVVENMDNARNAASVNDELAGIEAERAIQANERQKSAE